MTPEHVILALWIIWAVSWMTASGWTKQTVKRAGGPREFAYRAVTFAGYVLLFGVISTHYDVVYRLWRTPTGNLGWAMAVLVAIGFAFCWWARIHLGPLWSSSVTHKNNHRVIDTGPYALVRHPIYTGILLSAFATAIFVGTPSSFLGATILTLGWYIKARLEERFLSEELGPDAYDAYAKRVPMLVPFLHWPS